MTDTTSPSVFFTVRSFGGHKVEVKLFSFSRFVNFSDATAEMKKVGYQPAGSEESWSFAKQNSQVVERFAVVAEHGCGLPGDGPSVTYYDPATETFRQRNFWHGFVFGTSYRFLGKRAS